MRVRRISYQIALEPALMELLRAYDRLGGPNPSAAGELDAAVERCLNERGAGRDHAHERLQLLMRARDLHRYAVEEPELAGLKLRLYEMLLHHRAPAERWAAVRELLLGQIDTVCETPLPGLMANLELYKRALSDRASRLGKLLLTVALFNLDLAGEAPPPNLMIRFRRGAFPLHCWEVCARNGRTAHLGTVESWTPASLLARWEYLAADLAHALFQRMQDRRGRHHRERETVHAVPDSPGAVTAAPLLAATPTAGAGQSGAAVYCRFDADKSATESPQMDLFPVEPGALLAGLMRRVHGRHGPEGVKLLAVLLARLDGVPAGATVELELAELASAAGLGDTSARTQRTRVQRLERVAAELAQVELTRVAEGGERTRSRTSRLLTILGRAGDWHGHAESRRERADAILLVLPDAYLVQASADGTAGGIAGTFRDLPPLLLECAGKEHPCLLPLYAWLRRTWATAERPGAVERTARMLLDEAGIWVSDTGRYRAIEALKRDLEFMREQGWLGAWRLQRSELRDAMEDRYRLSAPATVNPREGGTAAGLTAPLPQEAGAVALTGT